MAVFYQWVKNIVVFLLMISMIYQLLPDSEYRKYMKVCAGMILMIIVFSPVLKLFGADTRLPYLISVQGLKSQIDSIRYPSELEAADDERIAAVTQNYKQQLEKEAAALFDEGPLYLTEVEVNIEEDVQKEDYGTVRTIYAEASQTEPEDEAGEGGIVSVNPVTVSVGENKGQAGQTSVPAACAGQIRQMKATLADYFFIDESDITISMNGGEG